METKINIHLSPIKNNKAICIILAYNCADVLENTFKRIPIMSVDAILLVDDASKDNTVEVAKKLNIPYFTHDKNLGYGGNVKYSLRKAIELGAEYVIDLHGDGQYDPAAIPAALAKAREGYDLVVGSRFTDKRQPLKDGMSLARYLANIGLSFFARIVFKLPLSEFHTGFRVYTRYLVESVAIERTSNDFLFSFQIIAQARYSKLAIGEIPIRCNYKDKHTSITLRKSIVYAFQMLYTLLLFILARLGFKMSLFQNKA